MKKNLLLFISFTSIGPLISQRVALKAVRSEIEPVIDGILDDEAWKDIPVFNDFKMVEPTPGMYPSEKTEIRVVYNDRSIYFAIRCYDSDPEKISANSMQHDNSEDQ